MNIAGSPDISILSVQATFDLSGPLPLVRLVNLSQGPNLFGVNWWFVLTSPTQTIIHEGSATDPDINGAWANFVITDSWPRPFYQIEWSGAPYNLTVYVQDTLGNVYSDSSYNATICRPNGNTPTSKNFYGVSDTDVRVLCQQASIYFQDQTNTSYKGISGILISSSLKMVYPIDETGSIPTPFEINNFSAATVPISYSSDTYQFQAKSVYDYNLSGNVHVRILYQSCDPKKGFPFITFPVLCDIDLMPLVCEYQKLIDSIENGSCSDVNEAIRKLTLINPKFALILMGLSQPLTGIDVPSLIDDIQEIGGFTCDCCNAPTGIIPSTSSSIDGYTFQIVPVCGDVTGTVQVVGRNIQLLLQDKSYVFVLNNAIPTTAFSVTPSTSNCTKTYTFNVNLVQLATDILNTVAGDPGLVNLFNSIVSNSAGFKLSVDGKCIFTSASTNNYTFTLTNIPSSVTNALVALVTVGGTVQTLSFAFNLTNLPALQAYLNSLGIGDFVVTNPAGQTVQIDSANNPNLLSNLTYSISSVTYVANMAAASAGYVQVSANQVVQYIINYLCGLDDTDIETSQDYTINYIDASGKKQTVVVEKGSSLNYFIATLLNYQQQTVDNSGSGGSVSCDSLTAIFPVSQDSITPTDFIFSKRSGKCAQVNYTDAFIYMLTAAINNSTVREAFCNLVTACGAGLVCAPYDFFDVIVTNYDNTCAPITAIEYTLS